MSSNSDKPLSVSPKRMSPARVVSFLEKHSGKEEREQEMETKQMTVCSNVDIPARPPTPHPFLTVNQTDNSEAKFTETGTRSRVGRLKSPPPPFPPGPVTRSQVSLEPSDKGKTRKFVDPAARPKLIPRTRKRPQPPPAHPSRVDSPEVSPHAAFDNFQQVPTPELNGPGNMAFSFGTSTSKPTVNLGMSTNPPANPGTSLFGQPASQPAAATTSATPNAGGSSQPQIDLAHMRSTTKFEHLTPDIQREIELMDSMIYNQISLAQQVSELIPLVMGAGETIPNGVDFVTQKLEELETGLGNDAEAIVEAKDGGIKKNELEAKAVFRAVDRLKMPRQYQASHTSNEGFGQSSAGGMYSGAGLSGWWNNPQTLRGSVRGANAAGHTMQLPGDDTEEVQGPKSLIDIFNARCNGMEQRIEEQTQLLEQIEQYTRGLQGKVTSKEREVNERLAYGDRDGGAMSEKVHNMQMLRYVFGEVQRSMYDVAEKVAAARDELARLDREGN
ncbi:hypothetical protein PV08_02946 [Exophiala spinifera]|uniref:Uncharacterized protein n=1 Tax=Exophiala spinifera TaxID=91928 RepID=A0A0D2A106_9EURO|nr:uncharacterized protein PV08_02946 [Exophiala spinifera]KIW18657.1 hypothetical protein PV08_02946 [Exophiala spinifera]